jgi:hypothetical protein
VQPVVGENGGNRNPSGVERGYHLLLLNPFRVPLASPSPVYRLHRHYSIKANSWFLFSPGIKLHSTANPTLSFLLYPLAFSSETFHGKRNPFPGNIHLDNPYSYMLL